jgi:hypothetical protein
MFDRDLPNSLPVHISMEPVLLTDVESSQITLSLQQYISTVYPSLLSFNQNITATSKEPGGTRLLGRLDIQATKIGRGLLDTYWFGLYSSHWWLHPFLSLDFGHGAKPKEGLGWRLDGISNVGSASASQIRKRKSMNDHSYQGLHMGLRLSFYSLIRVVFSKEEHCAFYRLRGTAVPDVCEQSMDHCQSHLRIGSLGSAVDTKLLAESTHHHSSIPIAETYTTAWEPCLSNMSSTGRHRCILARTAIGAYARTRT